jgi:hypothetical protein
MNHNRQTVLSVEPHCNIVFARLPTEDEIRSMHEEYEMNQREMEDMVPAWFWKPENDDGGMHQSTILDFVQHKTLKAADGPIR